MTTPNDPTDELVAGAEGYFAALDQRSFDDLVARVREPATDNTPPTSPRPHGIADGRARYAAKKGRR